MAFHMSGPLDHESAEVAQLFAAGAVGVAEEVGDGGVETVAYFAERFDLALDGRWEAVEDVDYVRAYRQSLVPVRVGPLVIAPTHRRPRLASGQQVVWLDPETAFGTGHHETTRLALEALTNLDLIGRTVLDVGAGSGILAIAADRLGAARALGVDTDPQTLRVARANARRNRSRARFLTGSIDHADLPSHFDVVVANLYAEVHASLMNAYVDRVGSGGRLLLTGILEQRATVVDEALPAGWPVRVRRDGDWLLYALEAPA